MIHHEAYKTRPIAGLPPVSCPGELVAGEAHMDEVFEGEPHRGGPLHKRTVTIYRCSLCFRVVSIAGARVLNDYLPAARAIVADLAEALGNGRGK